MIGHSSLVSTALGWTLGASILTGCASPEPRYYTLAQVSADRAAVEQCAAPATGSRWIEVAPVAVPERLNRANLILNQRNGTFKLLEQDRWLAPLPDELRDALSQRLQSSLGAVDIYQRNPSGVKPQYRVTTAVVSMDAELGIRAGAVINWTVQRVSDGKLTAGRTQAERPAPGELGSLALTYQQIVTQAATDIAMAVCALKS
ncbi:MULTISPECIES: PqiC family protein [unclassified Burkholderia]|uniref:PqiC family protein n=1 Tax=unclassified Burkholderia TaxID=2613784 RepID=UPI002ABE43F5|nr:MULTISPECIES: PqiC family protein [unclassified Burkholderia]